MLNTDKIYEKYGLIGSNILIPKYGKRKASTVDEVLNALYLYDKKACEHLGLSTQTFRKFLKVLFPDIDLNTMKNRTWSSWLLTFTNNKNCSKCKKLISRDSFSKDKSTSDGLKNECKHCVHKRTNTEEYKLQAKYKNKNRYQLDLDNNRKIRREHYYNNKDMYVAASAKRRAALINAIPPWADLEKIKEIYKNCPEGYQVDHIYPLQNPTICGLHVENNLQYLTEAENKSKSNKY